MTKILVVDDEIRFRELYRKVLVEKGFEVKDASHVEDALSVLQQEHIDMVVSDIRMPGESGLQFLQRARSLEHARELPFLLVTAYANVKDAVKALKLGAVDYLSKPIDLDELSIVVRETLKLPDEGASSDTLPDAALEDIVVKDPLVRSLFHDAYRVASSDIPVLMTGESGVGKEVFADFIHRHSGRGDGPFVAVNCGALPHGLLGSELFGHEKGAFTGATQKRLGHFQKAHNGTLFLDEIGELPLDLQPTLLRVLETHDVTPLGASHPKHINFRLLAATNRDLEVEMREGRFREDLYYRLNVIQLKIPPLRERKEDILPLTRHFLSSMTQPKRLSRAASRLLTSYEWPGNIRELSNTIERAHLLSRAEIILPEHLPPQLHRQTETQSIPTHRPLQTLEQVEHKAIQQALEQTNGNKTKAAEILGITRRGLLYKLKRMGSQ